MYIYVVCVCVWLVGERAGVVSAGAAGGAGGGGEAGLRRRAHQAGGLW